MPISSYSTTPASNSTISGINIAEGCAPSGINDAIRQVMADIKTDVLTRDGALSPTAAFSWNSQNLTGVNTLGTNWVKFPATQVPSTDVNTLDDYEEGTWTPTYGGTGGNPAVTYTTQIGSYVKIGRFVFIEGRLDTSAASGGVQFLTINGLPFACAVGTTTGGVTVSKSSGWTIAAPVSGYVETTTQIGLTYDVSVTQRSEVTVDHLTNGAVTLFFNAFYITSA